MSTRKPILLACLLLASVPGARAETSRRDVGLQAPDGIDLKATYFAPAERGPGILLLHMCGNGGRKPWEGLASRLAERGFHVLTIDYRGSGESGGERFEALDREQRRALVAKWPADFDVAFDFLIGQPRVDGRRVGIGGASCGVDNAVQLAIRHPQVRAIVVLSGGTNQVGLDFLERADSPSLFAAASADDSLVLPYVRWQILFSPHPENKLVEYTRAGHGTDMLAAEAGLAPILVEWLDATLRHPAAAAGAAAKSSNPMVQFWSAVRGPGGVARATQLLREAKSRDPGAVLFPLLAPIAFGSDLLRDGQVEEAVLVFQLGVEGYPSSAFAASSLAEAYEKAGKRIEAVAAAERSLQLLEKDATLDPEDRDVLGKLEHERLLRLRS